MKPDARNGSSGSYANRGCSWRRVSSTLDLKRLPPKAAQQVRSLLEGGFIERHQKMCSFSGIPALESHMSRARLARNLSRAGRKVMFATCGLIGQDLLAAKRDLKLRGLFKRFLNITRRLSTILDMSNIVAKRWRCCLSFRRSVMNGVAWVLMSNLAFSGWETIFKDPMTTAAAIDRLVHHSVILELNVPSHPGRGWLRRRVRNRRDPPIQARRLLLKASTDTAEGERELEKDRNPSGLYTTFKAGILIVVRGEI